MLKTSLRYCVISARNVFAAIAEENGAVACICLDSLSARAAEKKLLFIRPKAVKFLSKTLKKVKKRMSRYLSGQEVDLKDIKVSFDCIGPFTAKVLKETVKIPYAALVTYGKLAKIIEKPGSARAVGNALARNPVPVIIPFHRVIRSDGSAGGFTPGKGLKNVLIKIEKRGVTCGKRKV